MAREMLGGPYIDGMLEKENRVENRLTATVKVGFLAENVTFSGREARPRLAAFRVEPANR